MAKPILFYGVNGEGYGHCCRSMALIEQLDDFDVHVITYGDALNYFRREGHPFLHEIPGLTFRKRGNTIDWVASMAQWTRFVARLRRNRNYVDRLWKKWRPALAVTDFEPLVPRVAKRNKTPVVSIDNQAEISRCEMVDLPESLRLYQRATSLPIERMVPRSIPRVITSFHPGFCRPIRPVKAVVGPMVRKAVATSVPRDEGFALVYYKPEVGEPLLEAASCLNVPTRVFGGVELAKKWPNFHFLPHQQAAFIEALISCRYLVTPGGATLLGEAATLGKRVLCIPMPRQREQAVNAFYVERMGMGISLQVEEVTRTSVERLLTVPNPQPIPADGARKAAEIVRQMAASFR